MSNYKTKYKLIYDKLTDIASIGKDNYLEFYTYINEIIENNEYSIFEDLVDEKYNMNIKKLSDISTFRDTLWYRIVEKAQPLLSTYLSNIYKLNNLYQNSTLLFKDKIILNKIADESLKNDDLIDIKFYDKKNKPYLNITYDFDKYILESDLILKKIIKFNIINKKDDKIISSGIINIDNSIKKIKIELLNNIHRIFYKEKSEFIYYYEINDIIGELIEDYQLNEEDLIYYIKNGQYARLIGELKNVLICSKIYTKSIFYTNIEKDEKYDLEFNENIILRKVKIKDDNNIFLEEGTDYVIKNKSVIFLKNKMNYVNIHIDYKMNNIQKI